MSLDIEKIGEQLAEVMHGAIAPLLKRLEALETREPVRGPPGDPGEKGADADQVDVLEVVAELLATDQLKSLVQSYVGVQTKAYFEANPIRHGQDGKDGDPGPPGDPGVSIKGEPGKDGAGVADLLIDREGALVVTLTDGRTKSLGIVVGKDGKDGIGRDGKDGVDGLSFETAQGEFDAERGFVIRLTGSQKATEFVLPYMRHSGFWAEGKLAKAGESMTHDGALWIAKRDTSAKPCLERAEDWILAARKGRDGKDGRNGIDKTAPVKTIDRGPA
jgi:hypothetical protein